MVGARIRAGELVGTPAPDPTVEVVGRASRGAAPEPLADLVDGALLGFGRCLLLCELSEREVAARGGALGGDQRGLAVVRLGELIERVEVEVGPDQPEQPTATAGLSAGSLGGEGCHASAVEIGQLGEDRRHVRLPASHSGSAGEIDRAQVGRRDLNHRAGTGDSAYGTRVDRVMPERTKCPTACARQLINVEVGKSVALFGVAADLCAGKILILVRSFICHAMGLPLATFRRALTLGFDSCCR